jgi:hypothetical protein
VDRVACRSHEILGHEVAHLVFLVLFASDVKISTYFMN